MSAAVVSGVEPRLGIVSMNIPESNHILADLGILTWTQNKKLFPIKCLKQLVFQVVHIANFGLASGAIRQTFSVRIA